MTNEKIKALKELKLAVAEYLNRLNAVLDAEKDEDLTASEITEMIWPPDFNGMASKILDI